ncbi:MAG: dihydrolipoyllysine-residue acetyltransferase [Granulosicoccaceae bacterium]
MSNQIEVRVPDIGDSTDVEVIEVLVGPGDTVAVEDSLVTLESDKASMDVPSSAAGTVIEVKLAVGDKANEGDLVVLLEATATAETEAAEPASSDAGAEAETAAAPAAQATEIKVIVPDIGDSKDVEVIEILVAVGDTIAEEDSLVSLESDKASMEVPSSAAGVVQSIAVNLGDKVNEGDLVLTLQGAATVTDATLASAPSPVAEAKPEPAPAAAAEAAKPSPQPANSPTASLPGKTAHASPAIRKFARELGAQIANISGSGRKGRIVKEDVKAYVKRVMEGASTPGGLSTAGAAGGAGIPPIPEVDFTKFGEIERVEMGRIPKLSAANLHRAWLNVPHVTHHDEADITDLEDFRKSLKGEAEKAGVRVTALVFHMKVLASCLKAFPKFNSSITPDGEALIFKKYYNIGIAVDTPNGLVVPVFKDVDKKSIFELSEEIMDVSKRARDKKLKGTEMQGACMTISSLGGIGGTAFTPIVNAPEAAIMGITRARMQPVWNGSEFVPRLMCPLDMSYDHRIIDGADAARFMAHYCQLISDVRRVLL